MMRSEGTFFTTFTIEMQQQQVGQGRRGHGLLGDTFEMVRLHPVPRRYLETGQRFSSFQMISAEIAENTKDPRPESVCVKPATIELGAVIPASKHQERVRFLESSPHLIGSVEELKKKQVLDGTSLGIVKPKTIVGCRLEQRSQAAREEWEEKERAILSQGHLFGEEVKPIDFPATRFVVSWLCDDACCDKPHEMGMLQWGLHELNRKYSHREDREEKVLGAMKRRLDQTERDVYLFLGNFRTVLYNFGLMDSYSAPRRTQGDLFPRGAGLHV